VGTKVWERVPGNPGIYRNEGTYKVYWQETYRGDDARVRSRQRTKNFPKGRHVVTDLQTGASGYLDARQAAIHFKGDKDAARRTGRVTDLRAENLTLDEFFPRFLGSKERRPTTQDKNQRYYRLYIAPVLGSRVIRSISPTDVREWAANLTPQRIGVEGKAMRADCIKLLKTILNQAVDDGIAPSNPARKVSLGNGGPAIRSISPDEIPTAEEVNRLADAVTERYRTLIYLLAYGGLRIGEAAALRIEKLDLLRGKITIDRTLSEVGGKLIVGPTKTSGSTRTITLPNFLRDMLAHHIEQYAARDPQGNVLRDSYLFTSPEGSPLRPNNFRKRVWYKAVGQAGLGSVHPPDLRHVCASQLAAQGGHAVEIAARLGHANPTITQKVYTHILPSVEARLAEGQDVLYQEANTKKP
jgi:integrase